MPRIFDNIDKSLLPALRETIELSERADFCVGYFNLRGWKQLDSCIDAWDGDPHCVRLLVGMQRLPQQELQESMSLLQSDEGLDNQTANRLKKSLTEEFSQQLTIGMPTATDEDGLRRLAAQIKAKKVVVKLFLRYPLHAKLYLLFRTDPNNPRTGYLGSSNLTMAGLSRQGELNIDVLDHDATTKLENWFNERWEDKWCIDISDELVRTIEESWAREDAIPPYHIYIKIAYHLSQEARAGLTEFNIPKDFGNKLFEFQMQAVKIAAHHLNKRDGVLIGDVVGLGKTLMATALARIFEDDHGLETLIICPKNLVKMWGDYCHLYRLRAKVLSLSQVTNQLADMRRYRIVLIDESHNLRNREGKRYRAIHDYIEKNDSKVILLTATPYNKTYLDLSNQLRLFVPDDRDLGIRPEKYIRQIGETEFLRRHQAPVRSLAAFEHSEYPDDWRELMRLFMVRRTRSFIQTEYAETDPENGRKFLTFEDGTRSYFPARIPKTVKFKTDPKDKSDQYARLYADDVVRTINSLDLPRYGLGNYIRPLHDEPPTPAEENIIDDLGRAGNRLRGFCRTNLFKRLESSGHSFMLSVERHILRNYVFLHAIEHDIPIPIGTQDMGLLDARIHDEDVDAVGALTDIDEDDLDFDDSSEDIERLKTKKAFEEYAEQVYNLYESKYKRRFKWLRSGLMVKELKDDLISDADALMNILDKCTDWLPEQDEKLRELHKLIVNDHPKDKILIFTQFADTARFLEQQLKQLGVKKLECATGDTDDPTSLAWRFSPVSNEKRDIISESDELRVLVSTDVLSEGQNLQDCYITVNYDLPWAIIRLIQRVGRIDRIGQKQDHVFSYSFLPAEGVERIIRLRRRVRTRLTENAEVVGSDEAFFEDDGDNQAVIDLYNEKAGILDGDADGEVDLASEAYQRWKNAITNDPSLEKVITEMPNVVYSSRMWKPKGHLPEGVVVFVRTANETDSLAWIDREGNSVTESQFEILKSIACEPDTPAQPRFSEHHELVAKGVEKIVEEEKNIGGQLGSARGARFKTYERLKRYADSVKDSLFDIKELHRAIDDIYRYPLQGTAKDILNRQIRSGVDDMTLAKLVMDLREDGRLNIIHETEQSKEPTLICSLGMKEETGE